MRAGQSPNILRVACLSLVILLGASSATAQENKTVDGVGIGPSEWRAIGPGDSELFGSSDTSGFLILRNELSDRIQESWRHPGNAQHGPLITMFYERLVDNFFATEMFDADFRGVFNSAFASRGIDLDDARIVELNDRAKAAFLYYTATRCVFVMRVFGSVVGGPKVSNGDRNVRLFVCQRGEADDNFLCDTALSMLSALQQEGRNVGVPKHSTPNLLTLIDRLFTPEEAA